MLPKLERKLNHILVTKAPAQIPVTAQTAIVKALPFVALIGGVVYALYALNVYQAASFLTRITNSVSTLYSGYVIPFYPGIGPLLWLVLGIIIAQSLLLFMAHGDLKKQNKKGWDKLLYVALLGVMGAVINWLVDYNYGLLIVSLAGSVVMLYVLAQIRIKYVAKHKK